MKAVFLIIAIMFTSCNNREISKINLEDAFGIKFGEEFKGIESTRNHFIIKYGNKMNLIYPTSSSNYYDKYYIAVTPKTKKVYAIYATKEYSIDEIALCSDDVSIIRSTLEKKYKVSSSELGESNYISVKNGSISFNCKLFPTKEVDAISYIYYLNFDFDKLYTTEKSELLQKEGSL
ncbi:hypothetical protein KKC13_11990 [bacterium]|nr:hypothetical protein [bacterium]MBU1958679.1 hypothetical protein [bacterium]